MILKTQDPKYGIDVYYGNDGDGLRQLAKICNLETGQQIPLDEPVFILRAKDVLAGPTLQHYIKLAEENSTGHAQHVLERLDEFVRFSEEHPERMRVPG